MNSELEWWIWHHDPDTKAIWLHDHFGSFDYNFRNYFLDLVPDGYTVYSEYWFPDEVHRAYPKLTLKFSAWLWLTGNSIWTISQVASSIHPSNFQPKFLLSAFFRSNQPDRHLMLTQLHQRGWFNPKTCSKHFELCPNQLERYDIEHASIDSEFANAIVQHGEIRGHEKDIITMSPLIQQSFIHLAIETRALETTVCFPTEKFLYAVANQRLWLAVAPPNYHKMINQLFGFKLHACFDYGFDSRWEDHDRLNMILQQIDHFSSLDTEQQHKVYQNEQDTLQYNYQRLISMNFFDCVSKIDQDHTGIKMKTESSWPERIRFMSQKTS